ncbi:MAG TPA: zinc metalloprotease HtpX [Candidatus Dormibacteraeota bacterium]|jgi:heat shock protein HtpX|nr:zinc metalloprotease HtpX [Candidatus Dormibacteraeota bacterium]
MQRKLPGDFGLTARMFLTMFLLAVVYLIFIGVLWRVTGGSLLLIIPVAVLLLALQYYYSDKLILLSIGAREVSEQEAPQLHQIVARLAQTTGIPKPKVAIIDTPVPNALATGRDPNHALVAATTGILQQLNEPELEAVIAHELSHVIHRDMRVMAMASFFATIASFIVQMGMWGGFYGGGYGRRDSRDNGGNAFIIIFLVSAAVWAISFVLIRTLSRYREYAADRGSAIITRQPSNLASALMKISGTMQRVPDRDLRQVEAANSLMLFPVAHPGSLSEIFSTHPSLEHRLARLREMEAELSR